MDHDAEMSTGSVVAGSSSNDLGRHSDDSGPSNKWNDQPTVSTMSVSPPNRARSPANASHRVSCLVDGCTADLSKCREYHRSHRVCELHFKTPAVMVRRQ
ncbi:Squamosa promoter-binding-like protein [Musa troglodytarum]|uniref:Squamosa promoter-binding-like protein n=2 Tax=Musa troglodytarum TaxID=320322 RepID=A0A9E7GW90_9LILI|nr:Squamosa promoter-binding-like protein [Musa troglodytarum]